MEKKIVDQEATIAAQQKQELIKQEFTKWIFADKRKKDRLVAYYNRQFNNIRPREYYEMLASIMEAKRKNNDCCAETFNRAIRTEILQLYPNAKILVATAKDFTT